MSPARTSFAGFTRTPFTWTRPPSTAAAAALRVLKNRAAHSHLSTLACSMPSRSRYGSATSSGVRSWPMATMADLDELALAMPQTTKELSDDGRPAYHVHGKVFCFHSRHRT